ncbi:MAG: carbon monoxide dehydrogenase subunit G [Burkholderiales bacterium]|nr:carbon monoxide dehydrogenase subunit G [Burkholderiales bacterium]MBK8665638.1 carbon monoxide dehydrogenase subunit G [Burkholderiales bacterium]
MDMQGSRQLAVTQEQAWAALNDPEVLKACIPGCDSIEATGENAYALVNAIKVGPVAAKFKGNIQLTDIQAPQSYTLNFDGNGGAAGFGKGHAKVTLTPNEGGCELGYTVHATVGGKIAQVGQRLIDGVAKSMAESFFKRFDEEMQQRHPVPATPDGTAGSAPPAAKASTGIPAWVWVAGAIVLVLGYWLLRS